MTSLTLNKAVVSEVDLGFAQIQGLMLPDGSFAVSVPQVAELLSFPNKNASRDIKALLGDDFKFVKIPTPLNSKAVNTISVDEAKRVIYALAAKGNESACSILQVKSNNFLTLKKTREKFIQLSLQEKLGGQLEVECPAGYVDLLTPIQIIEIKNINSWKCALGQILVYGSYFPQHQKRIHLFGKKITKDENMNKLRLIQRHCNAHNVIVTW